jgi:type I restriction enzyme, S subunit
MNAERLLAHYEKIADAPDAIARLRRFILDLAVRGKLVSQDASDEPASELLKRIAKEKVRLDRKERTKRDPRYGNGEADPLQLPKGWALAPLSELVSILNGRAYKQNELLNVGTPVLRVGNLFTSDRWYYSTLQLDKDKYCEQGDLIFAWSASFGPFIWTGEKVIYHYHIWKLPLHSEANLSKLYLYNFLLQKTREIKEAGHGISMIHMTKEKMELIQVPLPPLAEQHRIVAKVDELMGLCDRLEAAQAGREAVRDRLAAASLARLSAPDPETFQDDARFALDALPALTTRPDQIKRLRQTILNLAVRGKLVPQDANDEPASELLKRIAKERARRAAGRSARDFPIFTPDEVPFSLPDGWAWARLGSLGLTQTGTTPSKSRLDFYGQYIPFVRPGDLYEKHVDYSDEGLSELGAAESGRIASAGSLLMVCIGTIGKCQLIDRECSFNQQINSLSPFRGIEPRYLLPACRSDFFQNAAWAASARTTIAILNKGNWEHLPIPVPPFAEQHRIVAKVDALMALCDRLQVDLVEAGAIRARLLEATLREALEPAGMSASEVAA